MRYKLTWNSHIIRSAVFIVVYRYGKIEGKKCWINIEHRFYNDAWNMWEKE